MYMCVYLCACDVNALTSNRGQVEQRLRGRQITDRLFVNGNVCTVHGLVGWHLDTGGHVPAMRALRPFGCSRRLVVAVHLSVHRFVVGQSTTGQGG